MLTYKPDCEEVLNRFEAWWDQQIIDRPPVTMWVRSNRPYKGPTRRHATVRDRDILAPVIDYSADYPNKTGRTICHVNYEQLRSGEIEIDGRKIAGAGDLKITITLHRADGTASVETFSQAKRGL